MPFQRKDIMRSKTKGGGKKMKTLAMIMIALGAIALIGAAAFVSAGSLSNTYATTNDEQSCQGSGSAMMYQNAHRNMMQNQAQTSGVQSQCHDFDYDYNYSHGNCSGSCNDYDWQHDYGGNTTALNCACDCQELQQTYRNGQ